MMHHVSLDLAGSIAIYEEIARQKGRLPRHARNAVAYWREQLAKGERVLTDCPTPDAEGKCPGHEKEA